jgi:hypothetical protein
MTLTRKREISSAVPQGYNDVCFPTISRVLQSFPIANLRSQLKKEPIRRREADEHACGEASRMRNHKSMNIPRVQKEK